MKKVLILPVFLLFLYSCQQSANTDTAAGPKIDSALLVSCDGIGDVKLAYTYADLEKKFGSKALSVHENNITGQFISIWENEPKQLNIYFEEKQAPFTAIKYIETAANDAPYTTSNGLKAGMTGKEIHQINTNMPVTMVNPFADTDAGLIQSFNNGEIATQNPCLSGHMEVSKQQNISKDEINAFQQEAVIESTHKLMAERMDVVLANMRVSKK